MLLNKIEDTIFRKWEEAGVFRRHESFIQLGALGRRRQALLAATGRGSFFFFYKAHRER